MKPEIVVLGGSFAELTAAFHLKRTLMVERFSKR